MFGFHRDLEKRLREHGRSATATILAAEQTHWVVSRAPHDVAGNTRIVWKLRFQVAPEGAPPFEAEIEQPWPQLETPTVGQVVPVLFDPDDHTKVVVDHSDAAQQQAAVGMIESRLSPDQAAAIQQFAGAPLSELMNEAIADPQGFQAKMRERAAAAQQAALAQAAAMQAQTTAAAGATPATPAAPSTPGGIDLVDTLARLADLRDRGVLTEQEFQARKKRLLGE